MSLRIFNREVVFLFLFFASGCSLLDSGRINETCEDLDACGPQEIVEAPPSADPVEQDTAIIVSEDTATIGTYITPDVFYAVAEIFVSSQQVQSSANWSNRILIVLAEYAENLSYPIIEASCHLILEADASEWSVAEVVPQTWYGLVPVFASPTASPQCDQVEPDVLAQIMTGIESSTWQLAFGSLSNATSNEFQSYRQQRLGGGVQLVDKAASLYLKTDWSGVDVVFSPGVLLAHPSEQGQPLENEHISLFGVNAPPDGFYYSYPLFHYGIPQ